MRYFFPAWYGDAEFPDNFGMELSDDAAAQAIGLRALCEMAEDLFDGATNEGDLCVCVDDDTGVTITTFRLSQKGVARGRC